MILFSFVALLLLQVHFTATEEKILDDGIRRSSLSQKNRIHDNSDPELVEFTEEEEEALNRGWNAARQFQFRGASRSPTEINSRNYCAHYKSNYGYYCIARIYGNEPLVQKLFRFCPSYKKKCVVYAHVAEKDPFEVLQHRTSPDFPDVDAQFQTMVLEKREAYIRQIIPCTPECNSQIWKHCTAECKCDYLYPRVQRFCNPPPIPFFLNTCRLWYHGCPKYQQYNYASQFIYSKAEKGKTIGGVSPSSFYGGATASGFGGGSIMSSSSGVSTPFGGFGMGTAIG
ncbi:hypothetical protein FO519_001626 [Halicephalobus sp. NKZ332]|nr:hypothetical protein FO519_001626 [Halicephalobus sp. NKZ332]